MARPRVKIDEKLIENMASVFTTTEDIALIVGCHKRTLERRFAAALAKGRARGKLSLRNAQFKKAVQELDAGMLRWLGINYMDQHGEKTQDFTQNNLIVSNKENQAQDVQKDIQELRGLLLERAKVNGDFDEILITESEKDISRD